MYVSAVSEGEAFVLIFFEVGGEFVGADGWDEAVSSYAHVFIAVAERGGSAGASVGYFVVAVAARIGCWVQYFAVVSESFGFGEGELLFGGGVVEGVVGGVEVGHGFTILILLGIILRF